MDVYILIIIVIQDTLPFLIVVKIMLRLKNECKGRENVEGGRDLPPKEVRELVPKCTVRFARCCDHQSFSSFLAGLEICPRDHGCFFYGTMEFSHGFWVVVFQPPLHVKCFLSSCDSW